MKTIRQVIPIILLLLAACDSPFIAPPPKILTSDGNKPNIDSLERSIKSLVRGELTETAVGEGENYGDKVDLYGELLDLFNPDKFACGLSDPVKKRLKESQRQNSDKNGFVPDIVVDNTSKFKTAIKLDGRGANILVHYFTYEMADNKESKAITTDDLPTQKNFNTTDWVDAQPEGYSNFFFTMDCAGYFSASAKVAARGGFLGIGRISVDAEGSNTITQTKSLVVMRALIYSPLYAAYTGRSIYKTDDQMDAKNKKTILSGRLLVLQGIFDAIPTTDQVDDRRIYLNSNYEAIVTSNKGNSGYNGTGQLNATVDINFVAGQAGANVNAKNSVNRKSQYENFDTYILEANKDALVNKLTIKDIKDKIGELTKTISSL